MFSLEFVDKIPRTMLNLGSIQIDLFVAKFRKLVESSESEFLRRKVNLKNALSQLFANLTPD